MALANEQHEVDLGVPRFLRPCLRPHSPRPPGGGLYHDAITVHTSFGTVSGASSEACYLFPFSLILKQAIQRSISFLTCPMSCFLEATSATSLLCNLSEIICVYYVCLFCSTSQLLVFRPSLLPSFLPLSSFLPSFHPFFPFYLLFI